jgi:hypothetical protein
MKYEYGAFVTGETRSNRRACTSANLVTTIPTEIGLESNTYFPCERSATKDLGHDKETNR